MQEVFDWLRNTFLDHSAMQTIISLSLTAGIGLLLAKLKIGKVSLGITFVFFTGILLSHFGLRCDPALISFAQSFGLILFVYALGVEVGPSFFPSLRRQGIVYNFYSLLLILIGLALAVILHFITGVSMPNMLGVMSGAVTNTPMLAAVQSTVDTYGLLGEGSSADLALACAVTYPMGVVGVILALMILDSIKPIRLKKASSETKKPFISEFEVLNDEIDGLSVMELVSKTDLHFIISRVWRNQMLIIPSSQSKIQKGDHVLVLSSEEDSKALEKFFGVRDKEHDWNRPDIDWDAVDSQLSSRRIIITNSKFNGVKLSSLRLRNEYGTNITRIDRSGIELLASSELRLQLGDRLTVVGEEGALSQVSKLLGDSISMLDRPRLISFFIGVFMGSVLGMIPIFIPGISTPIKLGLAGGPMIMGILMGAFGPRLKLSTYMTYSATQLIKQIGIVVYLAGLGLSSGEHFFEIIMQGNGLLYILLGTILTMVPTLLVGIYCTKVKKMNFGETAGMLCGAMANSMSLDYAQSITEAKHSTVSYASVYPVAMFLRIITAQILLMLFT